MAASDSIEVPTSGDARANAVEREQLRLLLAQTPVALGATLGVAASLAIFLYERVDRFTLFCWLTSVALVTLARGFVVRRVQRRLASIADPGKTMRRYSVLTFLAGSAWGAEVLLFMHPGDPMVFTLSLLALAGMTAGAVGSLGAHPPAYWAFALPCALAFIIAFFQGGSFGWPATLMAVLYFLANVSFLRSMHSSMISATRLRLENEALIGAVTDEKELAVEAQKVAEHATLAKSKFLAAASHDLRQPVHALGLFVGALEERATNAPDVRRISHLIRDATQAMKSLLDGLLDISKLDAGSVEPKIADVAVGAVLESICLQLEPTARARGLDLRYVPTTLWGRTDPAMFDRIARNLITNAIRYTSRGKVLVGCHRRPTTIELRVYDTGPGIPEDMREEIFVEFRQLHNPERDRSQGLGLGLAIVRRLAALLDHPIEVRSVLGRGSVFSLHLPYGTPQAAHPVSQWPKHSNILEGKTLLLIDDELSVLMAMQMLLESWGCEVHLASSGAEALELVRQGVSFDALLVDYRLRDGETGLEAIDSILAKLDTSPAILLITGDTAPGRIREARSVDYPLLHKPVVPNALRRALEKALETPTSNEASHTHSSDLET